MDSKENEAAFPSNQVVEMDRSEGGFKSFHKREVLNMSPENGQQTKVIDVRTMLRDLEQIEKVLQYPGADWSDRVSALEKLNNLARHGAAHHDEFLQFLVRMKNPLVTQLDDLRSAIVKEACSTMKAIAIGFQNAGRENGSFKLPAAWSALVVTFLDICLKQSPVTIKVISESAQDCINAIVSSAAPFGIQKIASRLCIGVTDKSSHIRFVCIKCLSLAMDEWTSFARNGSVAKRWIEIRNALKKAIFDSDENVRKAARFCFWSFHSCDHDSAEELLVTLDESTRRRIMKSKPVQKSPNQSAFLTEGEQETLISPVKGLLSEDESLTGSPARRPDYNLLDEDEKTIGSSNGSITSPNVVENQSAIDVTRHRAKRIQRSEDSKPKRDYHATDYSDITGATAQTKRSSASGPRRIAAPQRVINKQLRIPSSTSHASNYPASHPTSSTGAVRVDGPNQASRITMTNSTSVESESEYVPSSASIERYVNDVESSPLWSTRQESMAAIIKADAAGVHLTTSIINKLVPVLCERADDQHHKVAQEVLKGIKIFLPRFSKEFGEHLRVLLPALLAGLSDSHATTRRLSDETIKICINQFPADHLCAILSSICRKRGDKMRQGCVECLKELVPQSNTYFSVGLHVSQLMSRIEPCLTSRKMELRNAAVDLLVAVFRFDQQTFASVFTSGELVPSLQALLGKLLSAKIDGFTESVTKVAALEKQQQTQEREVAHRSPSSPNGRQLSHRRSSSSAIPVSSPAKAPLVPSTDEKGDQTQPSLVDESTIIEERSMENETLTSIASSTNLTPKQIVNNKNSVEARIREILNGLVSDSPEQVKTALHQADSILCEKNVDWRYWLGQLVIACLSKTSDKVLVIREISLRFIGRMASTHPVAFGESVDTAMENILDTRENRSFAMNAAESALKAIVENVDPNQCYPALLRIIQTKQKEVLAEGLKTLSNLLKRTSTVTIRPSLDSLMPVLFQAFNDTNPNLRRAAMLCYVELQLTLGSSFESYLKLLTKVQQKLVTMYIQRREGK